eukprot:TRINITY_DN6425_c0_g1_i1.p1 TRINITY_DN6425_c0_g1~~TRINITY_DN6425_c0_g1_i1.p1  ORF type:complete len:154 (+),score=47.12 TRINITY_DN6425_c0_g1_i1:108-569(+)
MKGYKNRPQANLEAFFEGRWFRTGDEGFLDEDKFVVLTGRIKEMINRGGEKIAPGEIDSLLLSHKNVSEAVTFGVPDEKYGEEVNSAIILKGVDDKDTERVKNEIVELCKKSLAAFKVPKKFFITKDLPRTATGKIQRRIVSAHFTSQDKAKL